MKHATAYVYTALTAQTSLPTKINDLGPLFRNGEFVRRVGMYRPPIGMFMYLLLDMDPDLGRDLVGSGSDSFWSALLILQTTTGGRMNSPIGEMKLAS